MNKKAGRILKTYLQQAEELMMNNDCRAAAVKYLNSILINKNSLEPYTGLALAYKNLKKYDKAVCALERAEKIKPEDVNIQRELAVCNVLAGEYSKGFKHLRTAVKLAPDSPDIQVQLALMHQMAGEYDMALLIYQSITQRRPDYLRAYIQEAALHMYLDDYLSSAKVFKQIIKLKPEYTRAYSALGICFEKLGNISAARRYYTKYLKFQTKHPAVNIIKNRLQKLAPASNKKAQNCCVELAPACPR